MQIDPHMLKKLLAMNDEQLGMLIQSIAAEAGVDPAQLGLNPSNIQSIRAALGNADVEDLKRLQSVYDAYRAGHRRP